MMRVDRISLVDSLSASLNHVQCVATCQVRTLRLLIGSFRYRSST